jgi:hypothetical protein
MCFWPHVIRKLKLLWDTKCKIHCITLKMFYHTRTATNSIPHGTTGNSKMSVNLNRRKTCLHLNSSLSALADHCPRDVIKKQIVWKWRLSRRWVKNNVAQKVSALVGWGVSCNRRIQFNRNSDLWLWEEPPSVDAFSVVLWGTFVSPSCRKVQVLCRYESSVLRMKAQRAGCFAKRRWCTINSRRQSLASFLLPLAWLYSPCGPCPSIQFRNHFSQTAGLLELAISSSQAST